MKLYEDGYIDLDEDINHHLPFNIDNPNYTADSITFRMLMTHTSSIKDNNDILDTYYSTGDPSISLADVIQRYFNVSGADYDPANNFHTTAPGKIYDYSNIATALAGYLVEKISGIPFDEYCQVNIFNKLCMTNTSWFLSGLNINNVAKPYSWYLGQFEAYDHYGFADYPDGLLRSSVTDLANFMISYLQQGSFHNQHILSAASVNEMLTLQAPLLDDTQGLNWYKEKISLTGGGTVEVWGHNGGEDGGSTDLYISPANKIGIAVISNGEGSNMNIVNKLYEYALTLSSTGAGNPDCAPSLIQKNSENTLLNIYPNPSQEKITIEASEKIKNIEMYNSLGEIIIKTEADQFHFNINLKSSKGIYFIRITMQNGRVLNKKIILE